MFATVQMSAAGCLVLVALCAQAKSYRGQQQQQQAAASHEDESLAVIPSPNERDSYQDNDIQRLQKPRDGLHLAAASEVTAPIYVSPFVRPERATAEFDASSESSHAPPNYAPKPVLADSQQQQPTRDLKAAASYGHHHHGGYGGHGHGYDASGWLDMGAWTGGKGSFGWYADYPVGGGHKHHYG